MERNRSLSPPRTRSGRKRSQTKRGQSPQPDPHLRAKKIQKDYEREKDEYVIGLAFSGGGIRSASFSSGVLAEFVEKRLYNSPLDSEEGNQREEIKSDFAKTVRGDVTERLTKFPRPDKVLLSAVSGGGYTAASYISWLKRLLATPDDDEPDAEAMQDLLYMSREFIRHMHVQVGYSMADYGNCGCSWRIFVALAEYLVFFGLFAVVLALTAVMFSPIFIIHTEIVVSFFGVNLLRESNSPETSSWTGPIWTWVSLIQLSLGLAVVSALTHVVFSRKKSRVETASIKAFVNTLVRMIFMFVGTVPILLTGNAVNAIITNLSLTGRFRVHVANDIIFGVVMLLLLLLPTGSSGVRNFLGLGIIFAFVGWVTVPLRLCDPDLLDAAGMESPLMVDCEKGVPLLPKLFYIRYSKQLWGKLLFWSGIALALFMPFIRETHNDIVSKFYQWRLKRAFFNRGSMSRDETGQGSIWKSLHWSMVGSCPPRGINKTLRRIGCTRLVVGEREADRDPQVTDSCVISTIESSGTTEKTKVRFEYISSFTFNLWERIRLYYVAEMEPMPAKLMGYTHLYGPFDDPLRNNTVYYKANQQNSGVLVLDTEGYHPLDTRFPEYYRILQRTPMGAYHHLIRTFQLLVGRQPDVRPDENDSVTCSEAMAISGAVVAPDMGDITMNRIVRTILNLTGISLSREVVFFPLGWLATAISAPLFVVILFPVFRRAAHWSWSNPSQFSSDETVAWSGILLSLVISTFVALASGPINCSGVHHHGEERYPAFNRLWRLILQIVSQISIVRCIRHAIGLNSFSRGAALTYKQAYQYGRVHDVEEQGEMDEQLEIPPQLELSDGGHTDITGALPLLARRCDEIYIAYGGGGADGEGAEEHLMETLEFAQNVLGCSFYVPHDTVPGQDGNQVPLSDIRNALFHKSEQTFPEDADPFFRDVGLDRPHSRPWSVKFKVVYPNRPGEARGVKEGTVFFLQGRHQPIVPNRLANIDMERAVEIFNHNGRRMWREDAETGEYNEIHQDLFGCCCQRWSTGGLARAFCRRTGNCGFLGRFPNHFTFNQCFYPRMFRAYHYHGRQALLEALGLAPRPNDQNSLWSMDSPESSKKTGQTRHKSGKKKNALRRRKSGR